MDSWGRAGCGRPEQAKEPARGVGAPGGSKAVSATVAIVWPCPLSVEEYQAAGRGVRVPRADCPDCGQPMVFWSGYRRYVRLGRVWRVWVARAKCRPCGVTHALLPSFVLLRRVDVVWVIGEALERVAAGAGLRPVAAGLGVPHTTARDWWRRCWRLGCARWRSSSEGWWVACSACPSVGPWPRLQPWPLGWGSGWVGLARPPGRWLPSSAAGGGWAPPRARPGQDAAGPVGCRPCPDPHPHRRWPCPPFARLARTIPPSRLPCSGSG